MDICIASSVCYSLPIQAIPSTFNAKIQTTHFFPYLCLKIRFLPPLHIPVQQPCALSAGEGKGLAMVAISILIANSLLNINLKPMLLSLSSPSFQVWAQAFLFCSEENEVEYWEEEAAKMRISATGQEAWGASPLSPNFLSFLSLLIRYKKRNFKGKSLPGGSLPTQRCSSLTTSCSTVLHPRNTGGENREGQQCN